LGKKGKKKGGEKPSSRGGGGKGKKRQTLLYPDLGEREQKPAKRGKGRRRRPFIFGGKRGGKSLH